MSAARFKAKDEYFIQKSDLTRKVLQSRQKKTRKKTVETTLPVSLFRNVFCRSAERFEVVGEGIFSVANDDFDDALSRHIEGDSSVKVMMHDASGMTLASTVLFDLSETMDQPFSKALDMANGLQKYEISTLMEVGEEGKGHYRLWLFYKTPVHASAAASALESFCRTTVGAECTVAPSGLKDELILLPLQGETALLQRGVFVNSVGKMIKDQRGVLETMERCPASAIQRLIDDMTSETSIRTISAVPITKSENEKAARIPESSTTPVTAASSVEEPVEKAEIETAVLSENIAEIKSQSIESPEEIAEKKPSIPPVAAEKKKNSIAIGRFFHCSAGKLRFAIPFESVEKIHLANMLAQVPYLKSPLIGIVRDDIGIIPVISACRMMGDNDSRSSTDQRLVVIRNGQSRIALAVTSIQGPVAHEEYDSDPKQYQKNHIVHDGGDMPILDTGLIVDDYSLLAGGTHEHDIMMMKRRGVVYGIYAETIKEIVTAPRGGKRDILYNGKKLRWQPLEDIFEHVRPKPVDISEGARIIISESNSEVSALGIDATTGISKVHAENVCLFPPKARTASPVAGFVYGGSYNQPVVLIDGQNLHAGG